MIYVSGYLNYTGGHRSYLARIGKTRPADEANCKVVVVTTLVGKKLTVYRMGRREMCIPYMKSKLSSLAVAIVNSTSSAVIVTDSSSLCRSLTASLGLFAVDGNVVSGRPLNNFFDPVNFAAAWDEQESIVDKRWSTGRDLVLCRLSFPSKTTV